jgi:hypothetical protein
MDYLGGDLACACGALRTYSTLRSYHVGGGGGLADGVRVAPGEVVSDDFFAELISGW